MEITGKYGVAKVFNELDSQNEARGQLLKVMDSILAQDTQVRVMPDVHAGKGCVIGFTQRLNREFPRICPNIVGVDIGCTVTSGRLKTTQIPDFAKLDCFIRKNIPLGSGAYLQNLQKKSTQTDQSLLTSADENQLVAAEEILRKDAPKGIDLKKPVLQQLKSLGSGNHFLELGKDDMDRLWLSIHSGSRQLGRMTASIYQLHAEKYCQAKRYPIAKDLSFLEPDTPYWDRYQACVAAAERFAIINHEMILHEILQNFFYEKSFEETIVSMHNYVDLQDMVVRKGAISAKKGELCLIPFNMRDGIAVCVGKGNDDWNDSAPHGAGRLLSRTKAKKTIQLSNVKKEMALHGIYTTSLEYALDEAPAAYKQKREILSCIVPTADVKLLIKPLYNVKGG